MNPSQAVSRRLWVTPIKKRSPLVGRRRGRRREKRRTVGRASSRCAREASRAPGDQAEALETARVLEARLREELGIDPSPEIRDLYRDILLQAPHLRRPPETPGNLPCWPTSFVGRKRELLQVGVLLQEGRLVTLTGPGGVGKTRLAIEVARQQQSRFPGGTWWIDLAPTTDAEMVLDQLASVLGLAPVPGPSLLEAIIRALGRRKVLLLIDNCERVATGVAELVDALLRATAGPRLLATSRTPLRVPR